MWKKEVLSKDVCAERTFNRKVKDLRKDEMVTEPNGKLLDDPGHIYEITDLGMEHIV